MGDGGKRHEKGTSPESVSIPVKLLMARLYNFLLKTRHFKLISLEKHNVTKGLNIKNTETPHTKGPKERTFVFSLI